MVFHRLTFCKIAKILTICEITKQHAFKHKIQIFKLGCLIPLITENLEAASDIERIMSNHGSTEEIINRISSENVKGEAPEFQTLTHEAVNEQIRGFIAPLTRQLEDLTSLVQGMTTSWHPNSYPTTELGTTSGTVMPQSDT